MGVGVGNAFSKSTKSLLFGFFEFIWARTFVQEHSIIE